jgi:CotH kinase protein/Lamin Tail Domain/Chitobiase/beta-hexosaminidase C-terminal domain/Bacterial TSP3 repeat
MTLPIAMPRWLAVGLAAVLFGPSASAVPVISEFMANNQKTLRDGDGDYSDWIEIHNPDNVPLDLGGYYLTDNPTNLTLWAFPAGTTLSPGDYLIVFASGKNPGPAGELHATFQLDADGEYLALVAPDGVTVLQAFAPMFPRQFPDWSYGAGARVLDFTLLPTGAPARALVPSDGALGLSWIEPNFDDGTWMTGSTGVGYDLTPDYLPYIGLNVESLMYNRNPTVYVRIPFVASQAANLTSVRLRLQYEDGIVLWLNGQEIYRDGAPATLAYNSFSTYTRADGLALQPFELDLSPMRNLLVDGTNVLACQGLNATLASSDLLIRPEILATAEGVSTGEGYMKAPTPGRANQGSFSDPDATVAISPTSRTFTDTVTATMAGANSNAVIRYTLDGSDPDVNSPVYQSALILSNTAGVRASAFLPGEDGGPTASTAFIRLAPDVQAFTSDLPVVVLENFGAGMIPDKRAHNPPAGDGSGIRQVPRQPAWMGIFDKPEVGPSVLTNLPTLGTRIGIRVRGSSSALQPMGKENYSVESWGDENKQQVAIRPFGLPPENDWALHAPYQYDRALIRNALVYDLMRQMGHYAARTRFVQVFVHTTGGTLTMADFSGVFVFMESIKKDRNRVDVADFSGDGSEGGWIIQSNRMDPLPEDGSNLPPYNFHTAGPNRIKQGPYGGSSATDQGGDDIPTGYNTFFNFEAPAGYDSTAAQRDAIVRWLDRMEDALYGEDFRHPTLGYRNFLDLPSFIDHYLMVNLTRNVDGLQLSTFLYKPDTQAKLHLNPVWDYDRSIDSYDSRDDSTTGLFGMNFLWFPRLFSDPEFDQSYVDRWQELRRSPLSTSNMLATIDAMAAEITEPIAAANFARWNASNNTPRAGGWPAEIDHMKSWLAARAAWIDSQYLTPPAIALEETSEPGSFQASLSAPEGTIYYTLDGSDPRVPEVPGSDVVLLDQGAPATAWIPHASLDEPWQGGQEPYDDSGWLAGTTGVGFDYAGLVGLDVSAMEGVNASVFVRVPFTIPDQATLDSFRSLQLNLKYEDGFVAYLNGVQVLSVNAPDPLLYNSFATASHADTEAVIFSPFNLTDRLGLLRVGGNVLAFQALNRTAGGTDLLVLPQLVASTGTLGGLAPSALPYTGPVAVSGVQVVTARSFNNGQWSGPVRERLNPGTSDPSVLAASLFVSEIMYHPPDQGSVDGDEFEFLELYNAGPVTLDLGGLRFVSGVAFTFPDGATLGRGQSYVLARNAQTFAALYPAVPVDGLYTGRLDNGGELLTLETPDGETIFSLTYDDQAPWPVTPDGAGHSLQRIAWTENGSDAAAWIAASPTPGQPLDRDGDGLPDWWELAEGTDPLVPDGDADPDGDGLSNRQEFEAGTHPLASESVMRLRLLSSGNSVQLEFAAAAGHSYTVEYNDSLAPGTWRKLTDVGVAAGNQTVQVTDPLPAQQRFYRLVTPRYP